MCVCIYIYIIKYFKITTFNLLLMILEELKIEEWRRTAHGIITMCQISNSYVTPWIILDNG